jgi:hypothetical protein
VGFVGVQVAAHAAATVRVEGVLGLAAGLHLGRGYADQAERPLGAGGAAAVEDVVG